MLKNYASLILVSVCLLAFTVVAVPSPQGDKVDVSGTWLLQVETAAGPGSPTFTFKQEGDSLSGDYRGAFGEAPVTGRVKGREVEFWIKVEVQGSELTVTYTGTAQGEEMKGTVLARSAEQEFTGTWTGKLQQKGK
jgi:hypothetical protein